MGAPACALDFGTDPVGAPDAWGDPDVVDAAEAADDLLDAPLDGEALDDVLDGDVVEEDLHNPFEPIPEVSEDLLTFVRAWEEPGANILIYE